MRQQEQMTTIAEQQKQVADFRHAFRSRPNLPVGLTQNAFPQSVPVKGPVWIVQDDIRVAAENNVKDNLFEVVRFASSEPIVLPLLAETPVDDVHVEWVGQRDTL
nr:hypothetical protein CFP56_46775 [Quercus suber]